MSNKRLTPKDKKEIEKIVQSEEFKDGTLSINQLRVKFGCAWHVMNREITEAQERIERKKNPETEIEKKEEEEIEEKQNIQETIEERDEISPPSDELKNLPKISLIDTPQQETKNSDVFDGNKFYCGGCLRAGKRTEVVQGMNNCNVCGGVLQWVN